MRRVFLDVPALDIVHIVHIYFYALVALFEGQLYPCMAQYKSGSRWDSISAEGHLTGDPF